MLLSSQTLDNPICSKPPALSQLQLVPALQGNVLFAVCPWSLTSGCWVLLQEGEREWVSLSAFPRVFPAVIILQLSCS